MSKIFVTSDTHFGHDREFLWGPRGFTNSREHDEAIIKNWNEVVGPEDIVYHLGDVMLGDNAYGIECVKRLNGYITIIPGNHDTATRIELYKRLPNVTVVEFLTDGLQPAAATMKYKKYNFYLSHHPTMTSNLEKAPYLRMHLINLYGHTHQQKQFYNDTPFMFHVGLDSNNNKPVLLDDAIEIMKQETIKCLEFLDENPVTIDPTS
jgi:calcineurin-like phosphoesterase family protein